MAETDATLNEVYYENVRNNQIGGETDGISPEVAYDLGYTNPADVPRILDQAETTRRMELMDDIIEDADIPTTLGRVVLSTETSKPKKPPTSAEQNASERAFMKAHGKRTAHEKHILPGQHF